jgi:hypothetical protein
MREGLSASDELPARAGLLRPVEGIPILFRAKSRHALRSEGRRKLADLDVSRRHGVVHSQASGDGRAALRQLASYGFRAAIGDHHIVWCDHGETTFTAGRVGSNRLRKTAREAKEFLPRFLHHILPPASRTYALTAFSALTARP